MEFFLLNVLLNVFLFLKVCDRDQVELEAMVLDSPKFYNHEYCSLVVIFHSSPNVMKIEVSSVLNIHLVCLCVMSEFSCL